MVFTLENEDGFQYDFKCGELTEVVRFFNFLTREAWTETLTVNQVDTANQASRGFYNSDTVSNLLSNLIAGLNPPVNGTKITDTSFTTDYHARVMVFDIRYSTALFIKIEDNGAGEDVTVYWKSPKGTISLGSYSGAYNDIPLTVMSSPIPASNVLLTPGTYGLFTLHDAQIATDDNDVILYSDITLNGVRTTESHSLNFNSGDITQSQLIDASREFTKIKGI